MMGSCKVISGVVIRVMIIDYKVARVIEPMLTPCRLNTWTFQENRLQTRKTLFGATQEKISIVGWSDK